MGHATHPSVPTPDEYSPAPQVVQEELPALAVPYPQGQLEHSVAAEVVEYVPIGQSIQIVPNGEYWPAVHGVHVIAGAVPVG